jgi:hypothetical protein
MGRKPNPIKRVLKLIAVDESQYTRLREYGKTPMSFNDIVRTLLDEIEGNKNEKKKNNVVALKQEAPLTN